MPDIVFTSADWIDVVNETLSPVNASASYGPYPSASGSASDSVGPGVPFPDNNAYAQASLGAAVRGNLDYSGIPLGKVILKVKLRVEYACSMSAAASDSGGSSGAACSAGASLAVSSSLSGPSSVSVYDTDNDGSNANPASASLNLNTFAEVSVPVYITRAEFLAEYASFTLLLSPNANGSSNGLFTGLDQYQASCSLAAEVTDWQLTITYGEPTKLRVAFGGGRDIRFDNNKADYVAPHWINPDGG